MRHGIHKLQAVTYRLIGNVAYQAFPRSLVAPEGGRRIIVVVAVAVVVVIKVVILVVIIVIVIILREFACNSRHLGPRRV